MSSEVLEMYETLDEAERFEVDSLIQRFVAAKNTEYAEQKDTSFIDDMCGILSHEEAEELRSHCHLHFKEIL